MSETAQRRAALAVAASFTAWFSVFSLWRYFSFQLGGDWCMIANSVASTARGEFFASRVGGGPPFTFWSQHISALLFVFVPFYRVGPTVGSVAMLLGQAVAVGLAGWAIFLLARKWLGGCGAGILGMLLFFANPRVQKAAMHDFHMLTFLPLFLSLAVLLAERRRWKTLTAVFAAGLTVREDAFLSMLGVPAYLAARRRWKRAFTLVLLAGAAVYLLFFVGFPAVRQGKSAYAFLSHYAWMGDSIGEIARTALLRPDRVVRHIVSERDNGQLLVFLAQFAFLPLVSLKGFLLSAPSMAESLLSTSGKLTGYAYHYVAPPAACLTMGALLTLRGWRAGLRRKRRLRRLPVAVLAAMVAGNLAYSVSKGALPFSDFARRETVRFDVKKLGRIKAAAALRAEIPPGAKAGYAFNLYGRYHGDEQAWPIRSLSEIDSRPHDYLLLDADWHRPLYKEPAGNAAAVERVLSGGAWEKADERAGIVLLRRKPHGAGQAE